MWKGRREDEESPPALSRWAAKTSYDGLPSPSYNRAVLKRQIDATDRQIDRLVYELYELTAEEIAIVEGAACS